MKHDWNADELTEHWALLPGEKRLLAHKSGATRLGFAVWLKFFQHEGRFPQQRQDVPGVVIEYVAGQIDVAPGKWPSRGNRTKKNNAKAGRSRNSALRRSHGTLNSG